MKLDLSALPEEQREEVRRIVDGVDEAATAATKNAHAMCAAGSYIRTIIRLNARICSALVRATTKPVKGAKK